MRESRPGDMIEADVWEGFWASRQMRFMEDWLWDTKPIVLSWRK